MSAASAPSPGFARAFVPLLAALAAALVPVGLLVAAKISPAAAPTAGPRLVAATLAGRHLEIDERLVARGPQQAGGVMDRLDIVAGWPEFGPPRLVMRDAQGRLAPATSDMNLLISLQPADNTVDPAARTLTIYSRFLERDLWSNPGGLVVRRFRAGSPYEGEELIQTPEGREFAARCPNAPAGPGVPPMRCIAMFRLAGLDATVSFDPALLPDWRAVRDGVLNLVARAVR